MSYLILIAQVSLAISPTDTSKINIDPVFTQYLDTTSKSMVCLELGILNRTIIDLEHGDAAREKVIILESENKTCLLIVEQTEGLLREEKEKNKRIELEYNREIDAFNVLINAKDDQTNFYQKKAKSIKRQRNAIIVGGVTISVGFIVGIIYMSTIL
jgi:hypothetical protein